MILGLEYILAEDSHQLVVQMIKNIGNLLLEIDLKPYVFDSFTKIDNCWVLLINYNIDLEKLVELELQDGNN